MLTTSHQGKEVTVLTRILIVDDHFIVRKGLVSILTEVPDSVEVEEAGSGEEALEKVQKAEFDLVLLDIALPGKRGLEVLKEMKALKPALPVLMLSMHPEEQYAVQSLRAGASGYLTKGSVADELMLAIHKVLDGGKYVGALLAEKLAYGLISNSEKPPHETLSSREYQVLLLIARGKTPRVIAQEMGLSVRTVNTFRARLLHKMTLTSNAELTRYALDHKLLL
jgi:two-component system, NarL family, invasion response regulator UvrY